MGKVYPKDKDSTNPKQKKRGRATNNRYLKPGTLARVRCSKVSGAVGDKFCTDLGKKRIALHESKKVVVDEEQQISDLAALENRVIDRSPLMLSPVNLLKQNSFVRTPKTPRVDDCESESRLESLPVDLLVKILCNLHHDQLRAVFHVSRRVRKAVLLARQFYFNYTTPDRSKQELLSTMTPRPTEHWPFASKGDGRGAHMRSPHTPKAPRHGPRPPSRLKVTEMKQIAAVLFQEPTFSPRCMVPSALPSPSANPRLLIGFCSTRKNYVRQLLKISFVNLLFSDCLKFFHVQFVSCPYSHS